MSQPDMPESGPPDPTPRAYEVPDPERPTTASPTEDDLEREMPGGRLSAGHDPYAALRFPDYRRYVLGSITSVVGHQMFGVAVGWELYARTQSATALGLVGLVQAMPVILLALPAGQAADLLDRKRIVLVAQMLVALCAVTMAMISLEHDDLSRGGPTRLANAMLGGMARSLGEVRADFTDPSVPWMYVLLLLMGVARAFSNPARTSLLPRIVPMSAFSNAVAWNTSGFEVAAMTGPALGGLLIGYLGDAAQPYAIVYSINAACALMMFALFLPIASGGPSRPAGSVSLASLAAGARFVWRTKLVLAAMTLDMFAVLLGGATALLPIFAKDILHSGATGLGWLRAAPSMGAFLMALVMAHLPPLRRAGPALLWAVAGFGAATIVFGLSRWFGLSLLMLFLLGALDNISVVIRHTLVQVATPDEMRGRVSAVNSMFIGSSNELGAFESGVTAAAFGPVASVVGGGVGTILVVLAVALASPRVRRLRALDDARHSA